MSVKFEYYEGLGLTDDDLDPKDLLIKQHLESFVEDLNSMGWDQPHLLLVCLKDRHVGGIIPLPPEVHPAQFLAFLNQGGPEIAREMLVKMVEGEESDVIEAFGVCTESWGITNEDVDEETLAKLQRGEIRISDLPQRTEMRNLIVITNDRHVLYGQQFRKPDEDKFIWQVVSTDESVIGTDAISGEIVDAVNEIMKED